ncbi:hypothetical protein [Paracoccus niistensis]|uniref:Uncharacterized protein n=1 Tax=Paracoccus niistensis TaxID=632935 RepID=A0ABV6I8L9_9RHOB
MSWADAMGHGLRIRSASTPITGALVILLSLVEPVSAVDLIDETMGVITDPLGIESGGDKILEAVERINAHLSRLQSELDADVTRYITEIERILRQLNTDIGEHIDNVGNIVQNISKSIESALKNIYDLESKIFLDTQHLVVCSAEIMRYTVQEVLANALLDIQQADPTIMLMGREIGSIDIKALPLEDRLSPIDEYRIVIDFHESRLRGLTENSSAISLPSIFAEMARLTERVRCHYETSSPALASRLTRQMTIYDLRVREWDGMGRLIN